MNSNERVTADSATDGQFSNVDQGIWLKWMSTLIACIAEEK